MRLTVPEQVVTLSPTGDRWMGSIVIDGDDYRIEAYPVDGVLADDLHVFAECGGPLRRHQLPDGTEVYLAVMPKGGTV